MKTLKEKYCHKKALFICGGPSMMTNFSLIKNIDRNKYVIFLETKALTPKFLELGIEPDFFFLCFPDKAKDNALQSYIFRSLLAKRPIKFFLKDEYHSEYKFIKSNFDYLFNIWKPEQPSKRYSYKPDVYLKNSPYDLLQFLPNCQIIARKDLFFSSFKNFKYSNLIHFYNSQSDQTDFDLEEYFNPSIREDEIEISFNPFLNSAAIAIYPIIKFMGFKELYLLGMDMNILGNMEFSAPEVFKSFIHFQAYFRITNKAFNDNYIMNRPFYFRPKSEFSDLEKIIQYKELHFIRISNDDKYSAPIKFIKTISYDNFF